LSEPVVAATAMWTSKLGNRFPKEQVERLHDEHHRELQRLRKLPSNRACAECREDGTSWASVNLGVFLCVRCSDVHRGVGTHISKVKGCTGTYLWGPDEIARMQELGNAEATVVYGHAPVPEASASKDERLSFCRQKYEQRRWVAAVNTKAGTTAAPVAHAGAHDSEAGFFDLLTPSSAAPKMIRRLPQTSPLVAAGPPTVLRKLPDDYDFDDFFASLEGSACPTAGSIGATAVVTLAKEDPLEAFLGSCLGEVSNMTKGACAPEPVVSTHSFWAW